MGITPNFRESILKIQWTAATELFNSRYKERGIDVFNEGRVLSIEWLMRTDTAAKIHSIVQGSQDEVYEQTISIKARNQIPEIEGDCTCPIGYNCKHVVAVIRAITREEKPAQNSASPVIIAPFKSTSNKTRGPGATAVREMPLPYEVDVWLSRLEQAQHKKNDEYPDGVTQRLLYVFETKALGSNAQTARETIELSVKSARMLKSGALSGAIRYNNPDALRNPAQFVLEIDQEILRALTLTNDGANYGYQFSFNGKKHSDTLKKILATGRCYFQNTDGKPLREGTERHAEVIWRNLLNGASVAELAVEPLVRAVIPAAPPWYIDEARGECGPIQTDATPVIASLLAAAPILPAQIVERVAREMTIRNLHKIVAPPRAVDETFIADYRPTRVLILDTHKLEVWSRQSWKATTSYVDTARLFFNYLGERVSGVGGKSGKKSNDITRFDQHKITRVSRDLEFEKVARAELRAAGFEVIEKAMTRGITVDMHGAFVPVNQDVEAAWTEFVQLQLPQLRAAGWQIEMKKEFRFNLAIVGEWYGNVEESNNDWFNIEIGIEVDGARLSLIPILIKLIRFSPTDWSAEALARRGDDAPVLVPLPDGRSASLPLARVRSMLIVLHEIVMRGDGENATAKLRLPVLDAARLADLEHALKLRWIGGDRLRALGSKLAGFTAITPVATPNNFNAVLRPYQQDGLAWLQFLTTHDLAGVLADDMGLGKTVQTLAHILTEKAAGRLGRPALVVAPTSMMNVWKSEAAKFAPTLKVLLSHGTDRKKSFERIGESDLVLTTYALLGRDEEELKKHKWHLIILDEAQNIKNAKTKAAAIASELTANHRLCLTGTPLENHLGELWSLFNFLLPGFLGEERSFRERYRTPIEREGDSARRNFLARRIKPFLLRRTKAEVAKDLPPKTEITREVDITGAQADLYETVRVAMDKRVRDEIAAHGIAKSHIIVLDALLKLRQICCDPRLVKSSAVSTKKTPPSAKLELLLEMLDELLEEGRSILVFSQFTSMLALIEAELVERKIKYVKLTGETRDRETPVQKFQRGEIKLFLISLKAGGTGLTLTAADTVIHYDPWWNPAVENQATDRAHRIGQTKPVFVYKLVARGTVEEKIVALQAGKAALAAGILSGEAGATKSLNADDLKALFEPLG
jgi:superfamily II DNA or RNA helicase